MKQSAYAFKHRVQLLLEAKGFSVAPIADSEYPVDLLGIRKGVTRGYRCKPHGKIYNEELQKLRTFAHKLEIAVYIAKERPGREIVMYNAEEYE